MTDRTPRLALLLGTLLVTTSPLTGQAGQSNALTTGETALGWQLLFDGESAAQWRGYRSDTLPAGWQARDGLLIKAGSTGDLVTREVFGDFELVLEWRLEHGGNAGLFYRATEEYPKV